MRITPCFNAHLLVFVFLLCLSGHVSRSEGYSQSPTLSGFQSHWLPWPEAFACPALGRLHYGAKDFDSIKSETKDALPLPGDGVQRQLMAIKICVPRTRSTEAAGQIEICSLPDLGLGLLLFFCGRWGGEARREKRHEWDMRKETGN